MFLPCLKHLRPFYQNPKPYYMYSIKTESLPIPVKIMLNVAQRIWFVWSCFSFLMIGIVALCFYVLIFNLIEEQKAVRYTHFITYCWGKFLLITMLVKLTNEGEEQVKIEEKACVIVSNHLSMCDIPVCMASSPIPFSFLAKQEADKVPVVGYLVRNMHIYVDRKSKKSRKETFERMKSYLDKGRSIMIYPEGTRNKTAYPLKSFYDGAFRLAIATQSPLVVLTICGSANISTPKNPYKASPAWVHTVWEQPISTKGMTLDDLEQLKKIVRNKMLSNLEKFEAKN